MYRRDNGRVWGVHRGSSDGRNERWKINEKEPAMQALAKRVNARGGSQALASIGVSATENYGEKRGPRNQPKRKGRK